MNRRNVMNVFLIFLAAFVTAEYAFSDEKTSGASVTINGVYSDMCFNEEGGDVLGIELHVVYSKSGYYVIYQASEGEPSVPSVIKATIKDRVIEFLIPEGVIYSGKFHGVLKDKGIEGKIEGYSEYADKLFLKRQLSYWQRSSKDKVCK